MAYTYQNVIKSVITGVCVILETNSVFNSWKPAFSFYRSIKGDLYCIIKTKIDHLKRLAGNYEDINEVNRVLDEISNLLTTNKYLSEHDKFTLCTLIGTVLRPKLKYSFLNIPPPLSRVSTRDSLTSNSSTNIELDGYDSDHSELSNSFLDVGGDSFQTKLEKNIYEMLWESNINAACADFHRINLQINGLKLDDASKILITNDTNQVSKKSRITQFYQKSGLSPFWVDYLLPRMSQAGTQSFSIPIIGEFYHGTDLCLAEVPGTKRIEVSSNDLTTTIKTSLSFHIQKITEDAAPITHIQFSLTLQLQMPSLANPILQLLNFNLDCSAANIQLLPSEFPISSSHLPTLTQQIFHISPLEREAIVRNVNTRLLAVK